MIRRLCSLVVALVVVALPHSAFAASEVFTVAGVSVDATSDSSALAHDIAIANGQRIAFQRLMQRITRNQDWGSLPSVSDDQLSNLLVGYEVANEHRSSTRYLAKVTYTFKPTAIRNLLRQSGIAFSEARARPALLLAVYETAGQSVLWTDPNPWRAAWARRDLADDLVPIIMPTNDLTDSRVISASEAMTASWWQLSSLAQRYGVDRIFIADAVAGAGGISVRLRQLSSTQESSREFTASGADLGAQLDQAVRAARSQINEQWKDATIVTYGQEGEIVASVPFSSLQDWLAIRHRIEQVPTVTAFNVLSLSTQGAEVQLRFDGTADQLKITLDQQALTLANQGSYWQIAMSGAGTTGMLRGADMNASGADMTDHQ